VSRLHRHLTIRSGTVISPRGAGFTMIEMMVTVGIAAILASIAIPSFIDFVRLGRLRSQTSDFVASLSFARSEAIRRGNLVTVCASGGSTTQCSSTANWSQGWIVFSDVQDGRVGSGGGSIGNIDTGTPADEVLRTMDALKYTSVSATNVSSWISFRPDGSAISNNGSVLDTLQFCNNHVRLDVDINASARVAVKAATSGC